MNFQVMGFRFSFPQDIVIDLGAHRGLFAEPLLVQGCSVSAYEPNPVEFAKLAVLKTRFNNFQCHRVAVGGIHIREVVFTDYGNDGHSSSAYERKGRLYHKKNTFSAPQLAIDDVLKAHEKVGLLKMNVEGAEMEILSYGSMSLFKRCKQIVVAFHAGVHKGMSITMPQVEEILYKFRNAGFELTRLEKKGPYYAMENKQ